MTANTDFMNLCKLHGWKCTPQRLAVFAFMRNNLTHPSVDLVWQNVRETIPSITRESVYRILNEFSDADIICRMDKIESAHYDSQTGVHGHLVCEECGKISDFELIETLHLPDGLEKDFIKHVEVRVSWICPDCRENTSEG